MPYLSSFFAATSGVQKVLNSSSVINCLTFHQLSIFASEARWAERILAFMRFLENLVFGNSQKTQFFRRLSIVFVEYFWTHHKYRIPHAIIECNVKNYIKINYHILVVCCNHWQLLSMTAVYDAKHGIEKHDVMFKTKYWISKWLHNFCKIWIQLA